MPVDVDAEVLGKDRDAVEGVKDDVRQVDHQQLVLFHVVIPGVVRFEFEHDQPGRGLEGTEIEILKEVSNGFPDRIQVVAAHVDLDQQSTFLEIRHHVVIYFESIGLFAFEVLTCLVRQTDLLKGSKQTHEHDHEHESS